MRYPSPDKFLYIGPKWQAAAGLVIGGTLFYSSVPIFFPHWTRRYHQSYNLNGEAEVVGECTLSLLDSLLEEMKMPQRKVEKLDIFVSPEPQFHGSFGTRRQALIGLPATFNLKSVHDLETSGLLRKDLTLYNSMVKILGDNLLLTEDEKQFILARQLGYLDSHHFWMTIVMQLCALSGSYILYHGAVVMTGMHIPGSKVAAVNLKVALVAVASMLFFSFLYNLFMDSYRCSLEKYADKYAATISPRIARAGISYYQKQMDINRVHRTLDAKLTNKYTPSGNQATGLLRVKALPLDTRKRLLEQLVNAGGVNGKTN